jgi:tetratricopeptide (TPR) repeat protein
MERTSPGATEAVGSVSQVDDHHPVGIDRLEAAVAGFKNKMGSAHHASPEVHNDLGVALTALGRLEEAIENFQQALSLKPGFPQAHGGLGNALRLKGRLEEAASQYERMLVLRPDDAGARNNLAGLLMMRGRVKEALAQYRLAIVAKPDHAETYFNLGNAFDAVGRANEAAVAYRKALAIRADFAGAHHNLGNVLQKLGQPAQAEAHYRRAIEIAPDYAHSYRNLGNVLVALSRHREAIPAYNRALAMGFADAKIYNSLGIAHNVVGQGEEAFRAFQHAVAIEPCNAEMHLNLATCKPFSDGDERLIALEKLAANAKSLPENDQVALHFALGKAFDDLKQPARSFHHLSAGNQLKRSQITYDEVETLRLFERIQAAFTPDLLAKNAGAGDPSNLPIFVVGMPRSGTTLIEQILASHPKVFGAGELFDLGHVIAGLRDASGASSDFPEVMTEMTGEALRRAGSRYLDRIGSPAPDKERIVDKMPFNLQFIGLICLALPNARVIHVRRDPLDTCFSCYSQLFLGSQPYAYDLAELGRCYRAYEGLMDHWRKVLPRDFMLEVRYENVVDDLEGEARRILDYCGLAWDEACLRFYETRRPVVTASFAQVRRPINRRSIGRWRPYGQMLQPLVDALGVQQNQ